MQWRELDLDAAEWRIPPDRQKLKKRTKLSNRVANYIVPPPNQALELLQAIKPLTGAGEFVFRSERSNSRRCPVAQSTQH